MRTAGGGGYGDPLERAPHKVLADVRFGYVSPRKARAVYGVVLSADGVDEAGTAALRRRLRARRPRLRAGLLGEGEFEGTQRIAAFAPATARRLRIKHGFLLEVPTSAGASLRAWARIDAALPDGVCAMGASGLAILGVHPGDVLEVRRIVLDDV
jgi:N-methylhydantoinase B